MFKEKVKLMDLRNEGLYGLNKEIICFGASSCAKTFHRLFPLCNVSFYCDNDENKENTIFLGKKVISPKILEELDLEKYIIIITSSYEDEIGNQLLEIGLKEFDNYYKYTWIKDRFGKKFEDGHFYSTIPDVSEIFKDGFQRYYKSKKPLGINLNEVGQKKLLDKFIPSLEEFYSLMNEPSSRYYPRNDYFPFFDASIVYAMLKNETPKKVIEVGSGYSSAVFLDSRDKLKLDIDFIFIDPFPQRLNSLLKGMDKNNCMIIEDTIQNISPEIFKSLDEGDILFIDSSHVSKFESDVNYIVFEVLPLLAKGVRVHFHDIFYPFEYPNEWILDGRYWNEAYLLRGFLQYNSKYCIEYWGNYICQLNSESIPKSLLEFTGFGGSIWLRSISD